MCFEVWVAVIYSTVNLISSSSRAISYMENKFAIQILIKIHDVKTFGNKWNYALNFLYIIFTVM